MRGAFSRHRAQTRSGVAWLTATSGVVLALCSAVGSAAAAGCSSKTPAPVRAVSQSPGDDWDTTPLSPDWLWATGGRAGDHRGDCARVRDAISRERPCRSSLCVHAVDLADEWLSRCPLYLPNDEPELVRTRDALAARSSESPTDCGRAAASVLRDGCGDAETCRSRVQRWATQCGESEGTPLVIGLLEGAVRRVDPEFEPGGLDLRKCDELMSGLQKAAKCVHRHRCVDALPRVEEYRSRCVAEDEFPSLQAAVLMLRVAAGAERDVPPFGVRAGSLDQTEDALIFESGDGAALRVCDERVDNLDEYLEARVACEGGTIRFARALTVAAADGVDASGASRKIHQGVFQSPDDKTFLERFSSLRLVGELDARDRRLWPAFEKELTELESSAAAPARRGLSVRRFVTLFSTHSEAIQRRTLVKLLAAHDAALVPVLEEIARLKVAAVGSRTLPTADRLGLAVRAVSHPLSDLRWDGVLEIGAPSPMARWRPEKVLPKAMAAYRTIAAELEKRTRDLRIDAKDIERGVETAREQVRACATAQRRGRELAKALEACAFGTTACDEPHSSALALELDQSHADLVRAKHDLFLLRTSTAHSQREALGAEARDAGCSIPGAGD